MLLASDTTPYHTQAPIQHTRDTLLPVPPFRDSAAGLLQLALVLLQAGHPAALVAATAAAQLLGLLRARRRLAISGGLGNSAAGLLQLALVGLKARQPAALVAATAAAQLLGLLRARCRLIDPITRSAASGHNQQRMAAACATVPALNIVITSLTDIASRTNAFRGLRIQKRRRSGVNLEPQSARMVRGAHRI